MMRFYLSPLRSAVICAAMLAAISSAPAHAFADDQARRAILDLREQLNTLVEQSRQIRVQQADQLETLQQEVARLRAEVERLGRTARGNQPAADRVATASSHED